MTYSKYPIQIDSNIELPLTVDNSTFVRAEVVNRFREAIFNIENELGVKPSSVFGTVRARLDYLEAYVITSGGGGGGPTTPVSQTTQGVVNPFGVTNNSVLQSDGVTSGGVWRSYLALGNIPATTGTIRLSYGDSIYIKNSGGHDTNVFTASPVGFFDFGDSHTDWISLNTNSGINCIVNGGVQLGIYESDVFILPPNLTFDPSAISPIISQYLTNTAAASGQHLLIHAQDCTGAGTTIGGNLYMRPGLGDGYGELQLQDAYGASKLTITSTRLIKADAAIQLQGTNVSTTADIRAANNTIIIAARNSTDTGNINILATDSFNEVIVGHSGAICVLTGSEFYLQAGGVNQFRVISNYNISLAPNLSFENNVVSATILQREDSSVAATGRTLLMHAQDMTGGGGTTGGTLALRGGHGDTHGPVVMYEADGVTVRATFGGPAGGLGASPGDVAINGATYTYIYVGGLIVAYGYAGQFSYNVPALGFASGVVSPYIQQDTNSTNNATAYTFTVGAQGVSGAVGTATAGDLCLRAGLATGSVTNKNGNVAVHSVPATWHSMEKGLFIANCVTVPDGYASGGSYLWAASAGLYTNSSFTFQGAANFQGALTQSYITKTHADTPYTIANNVSVILCDTVGGILTVTLPAVALSSGRRITILDWTGHATASPITIAVTDSTINGVASITINTNYGGSEVYCDGIIWRSLQASV